MKHCVVWQWVGIGACLFFAAAAQAVTLIPQKIAPNVYAFIGELGGRTYENEGLNANTGFIVTSSGVVVVDSGSSYQVAKQIHRSIQSITKQPVKYVINTGGQDHRWLGNGYFKSIGAEIIAQRSAVEDMTLRGDEQIQGLKQIVKERMTGTEPVLASHVFDMSEKLMLGGMEIQILHAQAHTPGDSIVWLPKSRVLFSGDLVYVDRLLGIFPFSNSRIWLTSFEAMEKLNPRVIVPGHGQVCNIAKARRDTKDYLVLLRTHMRKAVDSGLDLQTAIDTLDQRRYQHLPNYKLLSGGNASRTYLEMEAE